MTQPEDLNERFILHESNEKQFSIAKALISGAIIFALGYGFGNSSLSAASITPILGKASVPKNVDLDQFWKVWSVLDQKFGGTSTSTPSQEKVWGAIKGLTNSYNDPYTVFLTPKEYKSFSQAVQGSFSGVGMEVGEKEGILTVISPLKGSPAEKAGFKAGDKILKIEGTSTENISEDEAVSLIRGKENTPVSITIFRESENIPRVITVIRKKIDIPVIEQHTVTDDVYYIRLNSFTQTSPEAFSSAAQSFKQSKASTLILDLRSNPGGYLEAAVDIASHFLKQGTVIVKEDYRNQSMDKTYRSKGYRTIPEQAKIIVLVDSGSASASEILAGALKEQGRATLVGRTTYGKGSVQEVVPISKDTALKITVARWLTPQDHSLMDGGIHPDIEVTLSTSTASNLSRTDIGTLKDPDVKRAIELIRTQK